MIKYINDKSQFPQSVDELDGHLLDFEGHDRPRYVHPGVSEAGFLGLDDWGDYWSKPSFISEGIGTLDAAKFYSIVVVPVKTDISVGGQLIYGEATAPSIPVQPTAGSKSLLFEIPIHEQMAIKACGYAAATTTDYLQGGDEVEWASDSYTGYFVRNVETGAISSIYRTTLKRLYVLGISFTSGDRYQILQRAVQRRFIYAAEMAAATDVTTSDYYFRGVVNDNISKTFEMTAFAESADIWNFDAGYLQPPNANCVKTVSGIMFCGGGITEETGKAAYEGTQETAQASATADEQIAVTVSDDDYTASGTSQVLRLTLGADLHGFDKAVVGSYVDVTDSEDAGNDIEDARVLRLNDEEIVSSALDGTTDLYAEYNGTSSRIDIPTFPHLGSMKLVLTIRGDFNPNGMNQVLIGNWNEALTQQTATNVGEAVFYIDSDGRLAVRTKRDSLYALATVAATNWTPGVQEFEVTIAPSVDVVFKSNGSVLPSSGVATSAPFGSTSTATRWKIGSSSILGETGGSNFFTGQIYSTKIDRDDGAEVCEFDFTKATELSVPDQVGTYDGEVYSVGLVGINLNIGNGTASAGPVLTDLASEDVWRLECITAAKELFTATTPVVTGTGDGAVSAPAESTTLVAETWTLTCTSAGPTAVFSVVGSVSGAQADLTSETPYSCDFFDITVSDGTVAWDNDEEITFTVSLPLGQAVFSVAGAITGAQANLTSSVAYSNDFFTLTLGDGVSPWAVEDFLAFSVIKQAVTDIRWIEILNNGGVANAHDEAMKIVLTPNYIQGNASGADKTLFSEGLKDARFGFPGDRSAPYVIAWVDPVTQKLGLASKYEGFNDGTDAAFSVDSDYSLYYSDVRNPHRVRSGAIVDIGDSITGLSSVADNLLVFCRNSLWRIPIEDLGASPVLITDNLRCPAQFSIAKGERYVMFYDGTGISITDGVTATSVTAYKATDYLKNINKTYEENIRAVYDRENKRFEIVFPMGTETKNNYGLYITEGSWNCYPFSRPDCRSLWTNYDEGNLRVYHGTTGELTDGDGDIWMHDGATDGLPLTGAYLFEATAITGQTISVLSEDGEAGVQAGDIVTIYPITSGQRYRQMIVKTVTKTASDPVTYDLVFDDDYSLLNYLPGDLIFYGLIPFDYGVKWTDFSSPQYLHQVRALHLDLEGAYGLIYVDHYVDMSETPVSTSGYSIYPGTTKLVIPFRGGKAYKYGFRLRGVSLKQIRISAFEIIFDTQI